jgi:beta-lactamase class A
MKLLKNKLFFACLLFVIGAVVGYFLAIYFNSKATVNNKNLSPATSAAYNEFTELHSGGYSLINPLYECNTGLPYGTVQLLDLKNSISAYLDQLTANNSVTRVAVQFRDLNTGPWFGINNLDQFSPSSLLKLPVMMAYYKEAEANPAILQKQFTFTKGPTEVVPAFPPKHPLENGKTYTVEQLIESMIVESDNNALLILENYIGEDKINQVTLDLGIATNQDLSLSVSDYSTLIRVLYYSTYLNKDYSEKALELLSKAEFTQGLVALLPKDITVAHKFGEREADGVNQLHDCGIIYYPKHPYLLCIMTKGPNFNDLLTTIQQISNRVYIETAKMYH